MIVWSLFPRHLPWRKVLPAPATSEVFPHLPPSTHHLHRVGLDLIAFHQPAGNDVAVNKPTKQYKLNMKKIILSCIAAAGLLSITGCSTDKPSQSETTTTQQTTVPAPVTTTTTDTKTQ